MFKGQSTSKRSFCFSFSVAVDVSTKEATYEESDILKAFFPDFFPFNIIFSWNKSEKFEISKQGRSKKTKK